MLFDTSGLLILHHADAPRHDEARELFDTAGPKLVHSYVLAEMVALAQARGLPRGGTLAFLGHLVE
jgi:predicted nucleic acid-binding protein